MFKVTTETLSIDEAYAAVKRDDCGAILLFAGVVRDRHDGKTVTRISYTAFKEMAEKEFSRIAAEAASRWTIGKVYIAHRTGALGIGDASLVIAVSAPHRAEAFEACRHALEELKKMAPIWKEEFYEQGKAWIGG